VDAKLKISYDPAANAIYVQLADSRDVGAGETLVDDDGVIIDTDTNGKPRGYEFLTVRDRPVPLNSLPGPVARALSEFISSGVLGSEVPVERQYEVS
jgi:uncharacterized protein YuzE